ncbi:hypothetical protein [Deinococcus sp. Leaf326]|uniref:hypothetical protein n=1 Tax=Deinococcus sp. Leaf326 TaxID=1736338 RepID=UPI000701AD4F|nr:hypothetical protein [Deinococcus sp. Leaf326]KQR22880.1 hypothetical protein ASF71_06855 [Deinococcus sp. Leaf326]
MTAPEIVERTQAELRHAVEVLRSRTPTPATGQIIWWEMAGFVELKQDSPDHKDFTLLHLDGKPFSRIPFHVGYGPTSPWVYIAANRAEYDAMQGEKA